MKDKIGQTINAGDRVLYYDSGKYAGFELLKVAGTTKSFVKFDQTVPARAAPWNVVVVESNLKELGQ